MSYEMTGKLVAKFETVQRTETFKTREFVVEKSEEIGGRNIVNFIKFQCVQDKTAMIDRVNTGDEIKVYFNIKGTKWEKDGKTTYITNLDAWRIEQILQGGTKNSKIDNEYMEPLDTFSSTAPDAVDDLPF
jgi:phosphoketolase